MIVTGFDPVFRDITVKLLNSKGGLIKSLPPLGVHHPYASLTEIAGGNGVNIYRTLRKMDIDASLAIACNDAFLQLLNSENLLDKVFQFAEMDVNSTIILTFDDGENQINVTGMKLNSSAWTQEVYDLWRKSTIHVSSNWWLNPSACEWVSLQILSSGMSYHEICEINEPLEYLLSSEISLSRPLVIDPGMISRHPEYPFLLTILNKIIHDPNTILIGNEHEVPPILSNLRDPHLVVEHRADMVKVFHNGSEEVLHVAPLPSGEKNFVGAGDAFLAGFISSFSNNNYITNVERGISVAQSHILGTPPNE